MTDPAYTHLALILDRSGSMASIKNDMNGAVNALMEEQDRLPGKVTVDVTLFDTVHEHPYTLVTPAEVGRDLIVPRGGTALLDSIGTTVVNLGARLASIPEPERPGNVMVVVVTDGEENSSREWTFQRVKEAVEHQQKVYKWAFTFLGANIDSFDVGGRMGFAAGQTLNWAATGPGAQGSIMALTGLVRDYRGSGVAREYTEEERAAAMEDTP